MKNFKREKFEVGLCGFGELGYASDVVYDQAVRQGAKS